MGTTMNKWAFEKLIEENIEWLLEQPRTLERMHIEGILRHSVNLYYPPKENSCVHSDTIKGHWVDNPSYSEDGFGDEDAMVRVVDHTESTTVDIDLHRYKCTRCEKIMYYSGAARDFFEKGILSNVKGLDGK